MSDEAMGLRVEGVLSTDCAAGPSPPRCGGGGILSPLASSPHGAPRATPVSGALDVRWMCAVECRRVRLVGLSIS